MSVPDVFISYSREDAAWANAISDALKVRNLHVFLDTRRVPAGVPFESAILDSLRAARHLVVLWSPFAKDSDWVNREIGRFEAIQDGDPTRRLVLVTLKNANRAFASIQAVNDLEPLYPGDPASILTGNAWRAGIQRIHDAVQLGTAVVSIPVVALTMTEDDDLPNNDWRQLEAALGTGRDILKKRYGKTREAWMPSGDGVTIASLLETLRLDIGNAVPGQRFAWDPPDDAFWNDGPAPADYLNRFLNAPASLLVIDPVAIKLLLVFKRLTVFQACLESARTAIAVLPPFPLPPQYQNLRRWIRSGASPYFDTYFDPPIPPPRHLLAPCAFGGPDELRRSLLVAIGQSVAPLRPAATGFLAH